MLTEVSDSIPPGSTVTSICQLAYINSRVIHESHRQVVVRQVNYNVGLAFSWANADNLPQHSFIKPKTASTSSILAVMEQQHQTDRDPY